MIKVVGVHFRNAGKVYYFDPKDLDLKMMDRVVVETARGIELGTVMTDPRDLPEEKVTQPLKAVIRKATEEDEVRERKNRDKEEDAYKKCKELIAKHELDMKLVGAEYTFDNSKLLFYFTSDGRVDFRELVKDLAAVFRTRIELRQIGVRDETKILGGIGMCGREVCCKTFLSDFSPVSIKMAKTQNLSLNPTKISGLCGRLMCCLNNEEETYEYLNKQMPKMGDEVETKDGIHGVVTSLSILKQKVRVVYEDNGIKDAREYSVSDITVIAHKKKGQPQQPKKDKSEEHVEKELEEILDVKSENLETALKYESVPQQPEKVDASESSEQKSDQKFDQKQNKKRNKKRKRFDQNEKIDKQDRTERADKSDRNEKSDRQEKKPYKKNGEKRNDKNGGKKPQFDGRRNKQNFKRRHRHNRPDENGAPKKFDGNENA
jgi:cell fate regulator YaaT (PSP1 superfamily)